MPKKKDHGYTKQHIVPRAYLNGFATPGKGKDKYMIGVRQKDLKHYTTSTNNVGYIQNYYDIDFLDDKKQWEHYFADEIEAPCLRTITNLIAKVTLSNFGKINLTYSDKSNLSKFIVAQFLRVPDFIDYQINNAQSNIFPSYKSKFLALYGNLLSNEQKKAVKRVSFTDNQVKHFILSYITNPDKMEQYCRILIDKPWVVYINRYYQALPFITSDNPVVMTNLKTRSFSRGDNGIGNASTVIFFPINPYIAIGIYPYQFRDYLKKWESKELICSDEDIQFIITMNQCELSQCHNQAFIPIDLYNEIYKEGNLN